MNKDIELKYNALDVLRKSTTFGKHLLFIKILAYLIDAEKEGYQPKSKAIAIDLLEDENLGKGQDAYIRAQIHNLRKKLHEFYLDEGINETLQLTIPKGAYEVKLVGNTPKNKTTFLFPIASKDMLLYSIIAILLFLSTYLLLNRKEHKAESIPELFRSHTTTALTIAVESTMLYSEADKSTNKRRYIYEPNRNFASKSYTFGKYARQFTDRRIAGTPYYYSDPYALRLAFAIKEKSTLNDISSNVQYVERFKKLPTNLVCISSARMTEDPIYSQILEESSLRFEMNNNNLEILTNIIEGDSIINFSGGKFSYDTFHTTYFSIFKRKNAKGYSQTFIIYDSIMSGKYAYEIVLEEEFTEEIKKQFDGNLPTNFELIVQVKGFKMEGVSHEIVYAKELNGQI